MKLAVVYDSPIVLMSVQMMLEPLGWEVKTFDNSHGVTKSLPLILKAIQKLF